MGAGPRSIRATAGAVFVAAGLLAPAAGAAQTNCARAEWLATFDLAAARNEYVALLGSSGVPACGEAGLRKVAELQRQVATLLSRAEEETVLAHDQEAIKLVAQALDIDPSNAPARMLLGTLAQKGSPPKPAAAGFEGAQALWDAGYRAEAREQARKVATEKALAIPSHLKPPGKAIATQVKDRTADVAAFGSGLAIVLIVLAAVVALVGKLWTGLVRRRFINLGAFVTHPADAKLSGDLLKAVVAEEFAAAASSSNTFRVVEASAVELPDFLDVPEQLKPIGKLLQVLFRRTVLTLSATARNRGAGVWQVTGQIATRRRVKRQETFEVPASAGSELSVVGMFVGAWALCAMGSLMGWRWRRRTYPLGTTSWQSLVGVRLAAQVEGTAAEEERLRRSLADDHLNSVALAQLGFIESDSPAEAGRYSEGLAHLASAADVLAARPTQRPRWIRGRPHRAHVQWEPLWFQISYLRTTGLLHRYYWSQTPSAPRPDPQDIEDALAEGLRLAQAIAATWLSIHGPWRRFAINKSRRRELVSMLEVDDESYLGVLAGALVENVDPPPSPAAGTPLQGKALWRWLNRFSAERDLDHLLLQATTPSHNPDGRTLYNIACVWTRIGRYDEALAALRSMFAQAAANDLPGRMTQVEEDPTLEPLRTDLESATTLALMLAKAAKRVPTKELRPAPAPAKAGRWTVEVLTAP